MADFIVKDEDDLETNRQTDSECQDKAKMVISIKNLQYHRSRYLSPNENVEYGFLHSIGLLQYHLKGDSNPDDLKIFINNGF